MDLQISKPIVLRCGLTLPNRLAKAAMTEQMSTSDKLPDEKFHRVYGKWGDGGWGLILTGNVQVDVKYLGAPDDTAVDESLPEGKLLESWKAWATACNLSGTPVVMQLCHPGRQSPLGAGKRGCLEKTLAPSAVPLRLGNGFMARLATSLVFGVPREMTQEDIRSVVSRFANAAKLAHQAGFAGIEIHGAHGYLLAQFLSAQVNRRTDEYGGSATARAKIIVDIIHAVRAVVPARFCVGIKLNSVDHQSESELRDCIEQLKVITAAGVDFIEISGGSYENPEVSGGQMFLGSKISQNQSTRTKTREAFFLEFAKAIRGEFRNVPLMVTGGFRTRQGMESAIAGGDCDMIGIGRPACLNPALPANTIFNSEIEAEDAKLYARKIEASWILKKFGLGIVGVGQESSWYSKQIQLMGEKP
ncbi:hypothetical protein ZTR_11137 [Talaromyces verruculosus]|nr:hypothetical protein ZTR_11137 [Talaromyces verruculosus]